MLLFSRTVEDEVCEQPRREARHQDATNTFPESQYRFHSDIDLRQKNLNVTTHDGKTKTIKYGVTVNRDTSSRQPFILQCVPGQSRPS